ncbi:MAG: 50S ribosomal protein L21 [Chlamydiales bacterium]|nr:50S ribosomal protein L21 [Chlamydiales bacterium]
MYAIIQAGGKQYKVGVGDVIDIDSLGALESGSEVKVDVLFVSDGDKTHLGAPTVADFIVKAEFVEASKGPKVVAYKYKRRKRQSIKKGHRQQYSRVKITGIDAQKKEK